MAPAYLMAIENWLRERLRFGCDLSHWLFFPIYGSPATYQWQIVAIVTVNQQQVDAEAFCKACWIIGTNVLDMTVLSDHDLPQPTKSFADFIVLKWEMYLIRGRDQSFSTAGKQ